MNCLTFFFLPVAEIVDKYLLLAVGEVNWRLMPQALTPFVQFDEHNLKAFLPGDRLLD